MKTLTFDARFINELTAIASAMTQRECEWMSSVGLDREYSGKYDRKSIAKMEDIYWCVACGKGAAERVGNGVAERVTEIFTARASL